MSNLFDQLRTTFNNASDQAINYATTTYDRVSVDIGNSAAQIIPIVTGGVVNPQANPQANPQVNPQVNPKPNPNEYINPFEKQFESQYMGCYIDDPSNPSMGIFLGNVSNISECINLGKENNQKYVGIQQGNKCYGSNGLPITQQYDRKKNCNVSCDDINTGNCGGFFFNQVYKTSYNNPIPLASVTDDKSILEEGNQKKEAFGLLEKFINSDNELEKIEVLKNTNPNNNCITPINSYQLFFWLLILIILIYLLFEYLYKKKDKLIQ